MRKLKQPELKSASSIKESFKRRRTVRAIPALSDSKRQFFSIIESEAEFGEVAFTKRYTDVIKGD